MPGLVPEIEEREAASFNGYTWKTWADLTHDERVQGVAYARARRLIEAHTAEAQAEGQRREAARAGANRSAPANRARARPMRRRR